MNAYMLLEAFDSVDDRYVLDAAQTPPAGSALRIRLKKAAVIAAVLVCLSVFCGFAAYELGLFDLWIQKPSDDPAQTVISALEGQTGKEYTIALRIKQVQTDREETERMIRTYRGSELAASRGWTDEYLENHFAAVRAQYYVEYDHTKTFMPDGDIDQYFYLVEDEKTGLWTVIDNSAPGVPNHPRP